jgi:hypothetical protein
LVRSQAAEAAAAAAAIPSQSTLVISKPLTIAPAIPASCRNAANVCQTKAQARW